MNINLGEAIYKDARPSSFVNGEVERITVWIDFEKIQKTYIHLDINEAKRLRADLDKAINRKE